MKNSRLILIAAIFVSLSACSKDWTCTCNQTVTTTAGTPPVTVVSGITTNNVSKFTKVKKKDVRDKCASNTETVTAVVGNQTTKTVTANNCELTK